MNRKSAKSQGAQPGLVSAVLSEARQRGLETYLLETPLVVGVSGGADSLALIHMLASLRGEQASSTLHVAHLDHGFRGEQGRADAAFVEKVSTELGLPCSIGRVDVSTYARDHKMSPEEAAREVRYGFLSALARGWGEVVAVAHTADDQVETLLLHMLRGSGTGGLGGMSPLSVIPPGRLIKTALNQPEVALYRPLLYVWRHQIEAYCAENNLKPRIDATNTDTRFRRNAIRHSLVPLLNGLAPSAPEHLLRLAELARDEDDLLGEIAENELARIATVTHAGQVITFDEGALAAMHTGMARRVVRKAMSELAQTEVDFTFNHVRNALLILTGHRGAPNALDLPHGLQVTRTGISVRGATHNHIEQEHWPLLAGDREIALGANPTASLSDGWQIMFSRGVPPTTDQPGELLTLFDARELEQVGPLVVRTRRPGDFIQPLGMAGRKSLQDLYVDAKIPWELRGTLALVGIEGSAEILWVPGPGGRRSRHAPLQAGTERVASLRFIRSGES